ncbi:unnamed protein product [Pedinophyceae sp. YPF-701]|nr:unnamed protein product [Pedinophyceae sp. YPF-701]
MASGQPARSGSAAASEGVRREFEEAKRHTEEVLDPQVRQCYRVEQKIASRLQRAQELQGEAGRKLSSWVAVTESLHDGVKAIGDADMFTKHIERELKCFSYVLAEANREAQEAARQRAEKST